MPSKKPRADELEPIERASRDELQARLDEWHAEHGGSGGVEGYRAFLSEIGYLEPDPGAVSIAEMYGKIEPSPCTAVTRERMCGTYAFARVGCSTICRARLSLLIPSQRSTCWPEAMSMATTLPV